MPRTPATPPNIIYESLKDLRFIDDKGVLLPWSDDVWQKATDAMNGKMTKAYLYLYLSQNRNDIFNLIHGIDTLELMKNDSNVDDTANEDSLQDSNWSMGEATCVLPALRREINVSKSEWATLKTHIVKYKDREYEVLVIGWADALYDILWAHMKLPCPFSFKNAKINRIPGEMFLSIKGCCSECGAKIHIYCANEPTDDLAKLHVSTFDSRGVAHKKKGKYVEKDESELARNCKANRLTLGDAMRRKG